MKYGTVLITGGAGFIGSHTADLLISSGYEVIIYDNLHVKTHNGKWPGYLNSKITKKIKADVTDPKFLLEALRKSDYVIHLAAEMDLNPEFQQFMDINVGGTALIYELIVKHDIKIKKVVVASSQFVYGEGNWECKVHGKFTPEIRSKQKMLDEEWDQICPICKKRADFCTNYEDHQNPPNHYALSKYFQEKTAIQLGKLYNIPSTAMRYSIVHGPRQSLKNTYSGALRTFAINLDLGRPIATFEDNCSIRDFVSVYDVASANKLVLETDESNFQAYNVGGGVKIAVNELARILAKGMGKSLAFSKAKEFRVGDIRHAFSSIDKLKNLGWVPAFSVEDTIEEYIKWFRLQDYDEQAFIKTQKLLRSNKIVMRTLKNDNK